MIVLITGAAGAGKSTVGRALAAELAWRFVDADDLHAAESVEKMRRGIGLNDDERWPWLERVRAVIQTAAGAGRPVVVACSALREDYRRFLAAGLEQQVRFVWLRGNRELLERRVTQRTGHFASALLVSSQLEVLEAPPEGVVVLDAAKPVDVLVEEIKRTLTS